MDPEKQSELLKYLSQTHRNQFNERRKYEWKVIFSLLTFYVLCTASKLSGKILVPDNLEWAGVVAFLAGAVIATYFLANLHSANNINKEIAKNAEDLLMDIIGGKTPTITKDTLISERRKQELQITRKDFFKKSGKGVWAWRWQIIIVWVFAISAAVFLKMPPKFSTGNISTNALKSGGTVVLNTTEGSAGVINILIPVIGVIITVIGGLLIWYLNERSKRIYQEYKQEKYSGLIRNLRAFYLDSENKELKTDFLNQLNLCWMYCPDEVICKAYNFIGMVLTGQKHSDEEKERAVGELIIAIRKDMISRKPLKATNLKPEDFKHFKAT